MLYLANPSTAPIRAQITGFRLGAILTPRQGNRLPADGLYAIDNGCGPTSKGEPGSGYPGDEAYLHMLAQAAEAEGADPCDPDTHRCLFAVAPDVLADAEATLARSHPMLGWIDYFGFRPAYVAQNGQEHLPVPWDDFQALFLGGSAECAPCGYVRPHTDLARRRCPYCRRPLVEWKLGAAARELTAEARARGKWVHMGRVNSLTRLLYAEKIGCDSCDGTYLTNAPNKLLPVLLDWLDKADRQAELAGIYTQATLWDAP